VRVLGVSADAPATLSKFVAKHSLPFTLLSDPQLETARQLEVPTSSRHPMARKYPARAFLQPALFIWRADGTLAHQWRQTPSLLTFYGARGRPGPDDVLDHALSVLTA